MTSYADGLLDRMAEQMPNPDPALMAQIEVELWGEPLTREPASTSFGWRWTGPSGWTVGLNRHGDVYPSDSRVPAAEVDAYLAVLVEARARSEALLNAVEVGERQ